MTWTQTNRWKAEKHTSEFSMYVWEIHPENLPDGDPPFEWALHRGRPPNNRYVVSGPANSQRAAKEAAQAAAKERGS